MHARTSAGPMLLLLALVGGMECHAQVAPPQAECAAEPTRACVAALAATPDGVDGVETLFRVAEAQLGAGDLPAASRTIGRAGTKVAALGDDAHHRNALAVLAIFETVIRAAEQATADQADAALGTMAAIAEQAQESEYIALLFARLAEGHARAGRAAAAAAAMRVALTLAGAVRDADVRSLALADVAVRRAAVLSQAGDFAAASDATTGLAGSMRSDALYRIAEANAVALARSGRALEALKTLSFIDNAPRRVEASCMVADIHVQASRPLEAVQALDRARATAEAMREVSGRDEAFARIARTQARAGRLADAMATAAGLKTDVWRIVALDAVAAAASN